MDAMVGKVLDQLEKSGFSNNTIISFISDHGMLKSFLDDKKAKLKWFTS